MFNENLHTINRVEASIYCHERDRHAVNNYNFNELILESLEELAPKLDDIFDDQLYLLDRIDIEIDVSTNQISDIKQLIRSQLLLALKEKHPIKEESTSTTEIIVKPQKQSQIETFLYFLEYGRLPWYAKDLDFPAANIDDITFQKEIITLFRRNHISSQRFVNQFDEENIYFLIHRIYPHTNIDLIREWSLFIEKETFRLSSIPTSAYLVKKQFQSLVLRRIINDKNHTKTKDLINNDFLIEFLKGNADYLQVFKEKFSMSFRTKFNLRHPTSKHHEAIETNNVHSKLPTNEDIIIKGHNATPNEKETQRQQVHYAGLVLLHPFLGTFFKNIGLLKNGGFTSITTQQKAVCLLHYLATKETTFPEHLLPFSKFICHYPDEFTIPKDLPISEKEFQDADEMLNQVINQWGALKKTSIDGLRVNFLQRNGLLIKESPGYTLHVEKLAQDILLDRLPWNLSIAKLSWNPNLLTIKWQ